MRDGNVYKLGRGALSVDQLKALKSAERRMPIDSGQRRRARGNTRVRNTN